MNYRKSLIKKGFLSHFGLGSITKKDFVEYATRFTQIFEKVCGLSTVRIEVYSQVPYFSNFRGSDQEIETRERFNKEGMLVVAELSELPESFSVIPYVRILLHPKDEPMASSYAFGDVNFGNHLPSHIIFYAQLEEVVKALEKQLFLGNKAPRGFALGDGFENNTRIYVPASVISNSVFPEMHRLANQKNSVPAELLK